MDSFDKQNKIAQQLIDKALNILVVPSTPVDGDALGSALGMRFILEKLGKKVLVNYSFPDFNSFKFMITDLKW